MIAHSEDLATLSLYTVNIHNDVKRQLKLNCAQFEITIKSQEDLVPKIQMKVRCLDDG